MIEVKTKEGLTECTLAGSLIELKADTMMIIESIWKAIGQKDKDAAENFKDAITENLRLAFMKPKEIMKETLPSIIQSLSDYLEEKDEDIHLES